MKKQQRFMVTILASALVLTAVTSASALTQPQITAVKDGLTTVSAAEIAVKASQMVSKAAKADRKETAVEVIRFVVAKYPAALTSVTAAICKANPEMAATVVATVTKLAPKQTESVVRAAALAAPSAASDIVLEVMAVTPGMAQQVADLVVNAVPTSVPSIRAGLLSRTSAAGPSTIVIVQLKTPSGPVNITNPALFPPDIFAPADQSTFTVTIAKDPVTGNYIRTYTQK